MPADVRVVVDCDPGLDDAVALALATAWCDVALVTTVFGNAPVAATTAHAGAVLDVLGAPAPLVAGADRPAGGAPPAHDRHGWPHDLPAASARLHPVASRRRAAAALAEAVRRVPGTWVVALGPLTNVAAALALDPGMARLVGGIAAVAGRSDGTPEHNHDADPAAAAAVAAAPCRRRWVPVDVAGALAADEALAEAAAAAGTRRGRVVGAAASRLVARAGGAAPGPAALADPVAVAAVARPALVELDRDGAGDGPDPLERVTAVDPSGLRRALVAATGSPAGRGASR